MQSQDWRCDKPFTLPWYANEWVDAVAATVDREWIQVFKIAIATRWTFT